MVFSKATVCIDGVGSEQHISVMIYYLRPSLLHASLIVQSVNNLPAMQGTRVQFLGWEDPLEKEMVTHSSILAWRIPWAEKPAGYSPWGCKGRT